MADQPAPVIIQQPAARGMVTTIAGDMFDAFRTSPVLLLIVLLNVAFAGSAAYYLLEMEKYRADDRRALATLLDKCLMQTVPLAYLQQERGAKPSP